MDHVYLYENSDPPPAHVSEQLIDFVASGFVTFEAVGKPASQLFIYHACATQHRHKQNWLAFLDIDEFIVLRRCAPWPLRCALFVTVLVGLRKRPQCSRAESSRRCIDMSAHA